MQRVFLEKELVVRLNDTNAHHGLAWSAVVCVGSDALRCIASTNQSEIPTGDLGTLPLITTEAVRSQLDRITNRNNCVAPLTEESQCDAWLVGAEFRDREVAPALRSGLYELQREWRKCAAVDRYLSARADDPTLDAIEFAKRLLLNATGAGSLRLYANAAHVDPTSSSDGPRLCLIFSSNRLEVEALPVVCDIEGTMVGRAFTSGMVIHVPQTAAGVPASDSPSAQLDARLLDLRGNVVAAVHTKVSAGYRAGGNDGSVLVIPARPDGANGSVTAIALLTSDRPYAFDDILLPFLLPLVEPLILSIVKAIATAQQAKGVMRMAAALDRSVDTRSDIFQTLAFAIAEGFDAEVVVRATESGEALAGATQATVSDSGYEGTVVARTLQISVPIAAEPLSIEFSFRRILIVSDAEPLAAAIAIETQRYADRYLARRHVAMAEKLASFFDQFRNDHQAFYQAAVAFLADEVPSDVRLLESLAGTKAVVIAQSNPSVRDRHIDETLQDMERAGATVLAVARRIVAVGPASHDVVYALEVSRNEKSRRYQQVDVSLVERFSRQLLTHARAFRAILDRDAVIQSVPHDLTLPISIIQYRVFGLQTEFKGDAANARALDRLADIRAATELNLILVRNMLTATGATMQRGSPELIRLVIDVLEPILRIAQMQAANRNLDAKQIVVDQSCYLEEFYGIRGELMLVFHNIVANAVKYVAPGKHLRIRLSAADAYPQPGAFVYVEDHGIGVQDGWEKHIFERQRRAPNAQRIQRDNGLGLGLYTASQVAQRSGGYVGLESKRNPTKFVVYLRNAKLGRGGAR